MITWKKDVGLVEGGLVIPETLIVKVCAGMLLLELLILLKVMEFSMALKAHIGEDARLIPEIDAQEAELAIVRMTGKVILKLPVDVIGSAIVIEKL